MGKSPNRKDTAYATAELGNIIRLKGDDIAKIRTCRIDINLENKLKLESLIDNYISHKKIEKNSCTREDQFKLLNIIQVSAAKISDILSDYSGHGNVRVAYRLDDTLRLALEENSFNIRSRYPIQLKETSKNFVHLEPDILCPQSISDYMLILARAAEMALHNMEEESENDEGGRNANNSYDQLLEQLDAFFNSNNGKRGTKDLFFYTVINKIPKEYRIEYDWNSIKKRLSRLRTY